MKHVIRILSITIIVFCFTAGVSGATFVVNAHFDYNDLNPGDGVCLSTDFVCTLRAAITEANALPGDDTIILGSVTYTQSPTVGGSDEDNNFDGDWDVRSNITFIGSGAILQADPAADTATHRVLDSVLSTNVVTLTGVTIRHGKRQGAVSDASRGGGIRNLGGDLTINDSIITLNRSSNGGGIYNTGNISINNSTVSGNRCEDATVQFCLGGGMFNSFGSTKNITITGSTVTGNVAKGTGTFIASGQGGGMGVETSPGAGVNLNISNSSFTDNRGSGIGFDPGVGGGFGGGIALRPQGASVLNISNTSISDNDCTSGGGQIGAGIGISSTGNLTGTWDKVTVANNEASHQGSGIYIGTFGASTMALDIKNSTISNNKPSFGTSSGGGGLAFQAANTSNATLNFLNTTITGNSAGVGGGTWIAKYDSAAVTVNFNYCTIAGNTVLDMFSGGGGGLASASTGTPGTVTLKNTIIADNISNTGNGHDIQGTLTSLDYNHIENLSGGIITPQFYDTSGFDPELGPLQNNGGPTLTRLLSQTSPLRNAIPNGLNDCGSLVTTDQRGFVRPAEGNCDKGSVEATYFAPGPWSVSGTIMNSSGMPIRNAEVVITGGGLAQPLKVFTGNFGQYGFTGLTGAAYRVSVSAKRFRFQTTNQIVDLNNNAANVNFTANPQFEGKPPGGKR